MSEAATRKDVADMSDREMVNELAAMFDVGEPLPDEGQTDQTAEDVEATAVEGDEATDEDTAADQDTEVEATDDVEDEESESEGESDKWMPKSIEELAEALEATPEEVLENLKVRIKTDGKEGEATLKDAVANHQIRKTLDQRLEAFANEHKAFEAEATQRLQRLNNQLQLADDTVSAMEQLMFQDYNAVDWSELKNDDPTEYMLKQQEMRDRYTSLQEVRSKLQAEREAEQKQNQEKLKENLQQYVQQQMSLAQTKIPEWRDQSTMASDLQGIQKYLVSNLGATEQELQSLLDHRMYVLALKAMRYDELQNKADPKLKQMKTKPKFAKPGARKDQGQRPKKHAKAAFANAKKAQTNEAWAEALLASGKL